MNAPQRAVLTLAALCLTLGCASAPCPPSCCASCPERVRVIQGPPVEVLVTMPEPDIPSTPGRPPELASPPDSTAWVRAVLDYLTELEVAVTEAVFELERIKAARPEPDG